MARVSFATQPVFIDQVIQRDESSQLANEAPQLHIDTQNHNRVSNTNINRSSLPPQTQTAILENYRSSLKPTRTLSMPSSTMSSPMGQRDRHPSSRSQRKPPTKTQQKQEIAESVSSNGTTLMAAAATNGVNISNLTDFFNPEVFHMVLHNPTTAYRFLRYCQSRACGENIEFLQKISAYTRLLDEMAAALGAIHAEFLQPGASNELNLSHRLNSKVTADLKEATIITLPGLENIFVGAQEHIEKLLAGDMYPRFVKHQITTSATMALAAHKEQFNGLGDCFCMTDPQVADNPIVYASDGFVSVTGYSRKEIIPRNCRFLQGKQTDPMAVKRLRFSIDQCEETVELLLNYRKDGNPFWNLLYCAPLFNEKGDVSFFLGGQINCSTTIHTCTDVLKVLSISDDEIVESAEADKENKKPTSSVQQRDILRKGKMKSSFFKSWRKFKPSAGAGSTDAVRVRDEVGMEGALLNRVGKMNFKTQVEAFYTAYSKYLVLGHDPVPQALTIQHFSPGIIDMLGLNLPNGTIAPLHNKDIFFILSEHSSSSSSSAIKVLKQTVRGALKNGKAVSVELGLLTGFAEKKSSHAWFSSGGSREEGGPRRVEEKYITHWTPLKSEDGSIKKVILIIAPKT